MSKTIELYQYWRSSCSWRVRWALEHKGVSYKTHSINLLKSEQTSSEYLKLNPTGCVPCLVVDGVPYGESVAIMEWLEEVFPTPSLLPRSPEERMKTRQLVGVIASGTQPLQNLSVQKYFSNDPNERKTYAQHWISKGLAVYENLVTETAGTYSVGSQLSIADLCLIPQVYNANRFNVDMSKFPTISRINATCLQREDCIKANPDQQPDSL